MSQIGNIQNGPQLQPEQNVQSTQSTAVQQAEKSLELRLAAYQR